MRLMSPWTMKGGCWRSTTAGKTADVPEGQDSPAPRQVVLIASSIEQARRQFIRTAIANSSLPGSGESKSGCCPFHRARHGRFKLSALVQGGRFLERHPPP